MPFLCFPQNFDQFLYFLLHFVQFLLNFDQFLHFMFDHFTQTKLHSIHALVHLLHKYPLMYVLDFIICLSFRHTIIFLKLLVFLAFFGFLHRFCESWLITTFVALVIHFKL